MDHKTTTTTITMQIEVDCSDEAEALICARSLKASLHNQKAMLFAEGRNPKLLSCTVKQKTCRELDV